MSKLVKTYSKWVKTVKIWLNLTKLVQTSYSELFKMVQTCQNWFKESQLLKICSNSFFKISSNSFKIDQNLFKPVQIQIGSHFSNKLAQILFYLFQMVPNFTKLLKLLSKLFALLLYRSKKFFFIWSLNRKVFSALFMSYCV